MKDISYGTDGDYELRILAHIEDFGCHITSVFDPEGQDPEFAYSTGFTRTVKQGEVIVFGLGREVMGFMINETLRQCESGMQLDDWARITGLVEGFDIIARKVPPQMITKEHFNSAMWFHREEFGTDLSTAYQLVWPSSKSGLFPWDRDCPADMTKWQPALYLTEAAH